MQIVKQSGINWREKRGLISKLHIDQRVEVRQDQGETKSMKTGSEVRYGRCLAQILCNLYCEYTTNDALEETGNFRIGRKVIRIVKHDDLV